MRDLTYSVTLHLKTKYYQSGPTDCKTSKKLQITHEFSTGIEELSIYYGTYKWLRKLPKDLHFWC